MDFLAELEDSVVCGDGAMGTELIAAGVPLDACLEQVSLTRPELVLKLHTAYAEAGACLIETNTFGANAVRLERHGLADQVVALN
ncbi:MAG: homocysteine S-methyltransferase family protein, partial [Verrucomicrobia bacterium]|nr:homocysteine S-methyltransferase family protein [Verrucomicrobiota bacterium]